jgi:hypothetical protein
VNATIDPILAYRTELQSAASRAVAGRRRRRLWMLALAVIAVGALVTGISIAATGWLLGEPAPKPVIEDFKTCAPQLGFHPEPGKAVLVARVREFKLYATTNREGTYCLVLDRRSLPAGASGDGASASRCATRLNLSRLLSSAVVAGRCGPHQGRKGADDQIRESGG